MTHNAAAPPRPLFHIRVDRELTHPQVLALLEEHLAGMRTASPPECVFALDLNGLRRPAITFLTAWRLPAPGSAGAPPGDAEGELVAMGALKELVPTAAEKGGHGEIKSMRTSARHLRQGAAQAILTELLNLARQRGYARVSLETGSTPPFDAAIAMYRRFGFVACGPFADYREDPFSRFTTLGLVRICRSRTNNRNSMAKDKTWPQLLEFRLDDPYGHDSIKEQYLLNFLRGFYHQSGTATPHQACPPCHFSVSAGQATNCSKMPRPGLGLILSLHHHLTMGIYCVVSLMGCKFRIRSV